MGDFVHTPTYTLSLGGEQHLLSVHDLELLRDGVARFLSSQSEEEAPEREQAKHLQTILTRLLSLGSQRWLEVPLIYSQEMDAVDGDGERQSAVESAISMRLFYSFQEHTIDAHVHFILSCILSEFVSSEDAHDDAYEHVKRALLRWQANLTTSGRPSEEEANDIARQLTILGIWHLCPALAQEQTDKREKE